MTDSATRPANPLRLRRLGGAVVGVALVAAVVLAVVGVVGIIAAMKAQELGKNTVGFVGGMDVPLIHKFEAGYKAGVKYVDALVDAVRRLTAERVEQRPPFAEAGLDDRVTVHELDYHDLPFADSSFDVVLFLEDSLPGQYRVSGFSQGKYSVQRDPRSGEEFVVQAGLGAAELVGASRSFRAERLQLDDLLQRALPQIYEGE